MTTVHRRLHKLWLFIELNILGPLLYHTIGRAFRGDDGVERMTKWLTDRILEADDDEKIEMIRYMRLLRMRQAKKG